MPAYGNYDAEVNMQISRYDFAQIIACARVQCLIRPVVIVYDAVNQPTGYPAGQVLAQYTSGPSAPFFATYASGAVSGLNTAVCVLLVDSVPPSGGTLAVPACFRGNLYSTKLWGLDANAKTNLGGRVVGDFNGSNQIFIF